MLKLTKRKAQTNGGRASYYITGTTPAGNRIRESTGTDRRELAKQIFVSRQAEIIKDVLEGPGTDISFAEAVELYVKAEKPKRFLKPLLLHFKEKMLSEISAGEVREAAIALYPNAKASTRNRQAIAPFLAVVNHAGDLGRAKPIMVRRFKESKVKRTAIDRAWIDAFRSSCPHPYVRTLALFMFTTGARLGDALSLKPDDIDLTARVARVRQTKNGDPHDFLLTHEMAEEIAVLPARNGRAFGFRSKRHVYKHWHAAVQKARISNVTPHEGGRHSFATEMIVRQGRDVVTTAALGNWKSPKVLLERYAHAENLRRIVDDSFGGKKRKGLRVVGGSDAD